MFVMADAYEPNHADLDPPDRVNPSPPCEQGHPVPRTGTGSTLSIASALDSLVTNTEWSDLPPRLLQVP